MTTAAPYCVFAKLVSETVCLRSGSCWLEIYNWTQSIGGPIIENFYFLALIVNTSSWWPEQRTKVSAARWRCKLGGSGGVEGNHGSQTVCAWWRFKRVDYWRHDMAQGMMQLMVYVAVCPLRRAGGLRPRAQPCSSITGSPILQAQCNISNQQLSDLNHTVSDTYLAKTQYG